ncbi:MAG: hypothetical protein H6729_06125, partial [Deltaproteobacteria bacterium]|nr:hypothetical protein [Deltaproteobacteria bacterium]
HARSIHHGSASLGGGSAELLSKLGQLMQLQQAFGGLLGGTHVRGFDEAMSTLAALKSIVGSHGAIAHDYAASLAPALTHIASPAQRMNQAIAQAQAAALTQQVQASALAVPIVRAIETVAESGTLSRFGSRAGAIHHDPFAAALRRRHSSTHGGGHKTHRHDIDNDDDDRDHRRTRDHDRSYKSSAGRADKEAVDRNVKMIRDEQSGLFGSVFADVPAMTRQVVGLNTAERLKVLSKLSDSEVGVMSTPGWTSDDVGHVVGALVLDAKKAPSEANKQMGRVLEGIKSSFGSLPGDVHATLHQAFRDIAGQDDLGTNGAKDKIAKALKHVDRENLDRMEEMGRAGWDNQEILDVVARARVAKGGFNEDATAAASALSRQDQPLAKDNLLSLRSTDRLKVLENASQQDFDVFVDTIAEDDDRGAAHLLRELSQDARSHGELGNKVIGRFLTSLDNQPWDKGDVLEEFVRTITRGDMKSEEAMRLANRTLSGLNGANLSAMETMLKGTYPYSDGDAVNVIQRVRFKRT